MQIPVAITLLLVLLPSLVAVENDSGEALQDAWRDSVLLLYDDAQRIFQAGIKDDLEDPREWRFGQAVTLLNVQPRTEANITRAETALRELVDERPDDEIGILSRYYLGRIAQVQRMTPDPDTALVIYQALLDDHPDHLFAQYGGVKWAITYLGTAPTPQARFDRLEEIERLTERITLPGPAKDLHLFIADAIMRSDGSNQRCMAHLIAAVDYGIRKRNLRGEIFVRIGELARLEGETDIALDYYGRFLEEFPRDLRTYTITRTVADLEAKR